MEPSQGLSVNNLSSPPASGCHRLPQMPSMCRNVRTAQSKTSAKFSFESKPRDEAAVLHVEGTSKVVKILTDGISELSDFEGKESMQNATPTLSNDQDIPLINDTAVAKGDNSNCYSTPTIPKRKRQKNDGTISKMKKGMSLNPASTKVCIRDISLSSDSLIAPSPCDKTKCDTNSTDYDTLHLERSEKVVSEIMMGESSDCLFQPEDAGKKESPLEKKKRTSKMGIESNDGEPRNVGCAQMAPVSDDRCSFMVQSKNTKAQAAEMNPEQMKVSNASLTGHVPRCVLILPTEVPSESQLEKLLAMHSASYDLQYPPQWFEGDLLWAKVSGHPYWPCMVSRCPFSKLYSRIKGDVRIIRSFHVQFFGNEAERGWINEPSLMVFEGKLKFLEMAQVELTRGKKGKSTYNPFKVNISRRHAWNIAVEEAEGAISLSREERNVQYTFDYVFMDDLKKEKQKLKQELHEPKGTQIDNAAASKPKVAGSRKRPHSEGQHNLSPTSNKYKRRKIDIGSSPTPVAPLVAETSFDAYYANHRSSVIEQHPEWDTPFVFEYLRQQWESEKKKTSKSRAKSPYSAPRNSIRGIGTTSLLLPQSGEGIRQDKPQSKLGKLLSKDSPITDLSRQENTEQIDRSQPRKRGRKPKSLCLQPEPEVEAAASSPSVTTESVDEVPDLEEDTARPKAAASALSARKASQESDSSTEGKGKGLKENEPYELEIFKLNSTGKIEKDKICAVCEKNGDLIECTGPCGQHFHVSCVSLEAQAPVEQYLCTECTSGHHTCFACKKADMETVKCSVNLCGKYYHEDCIRKYRLTRLENKGFICPLHTCATCAVDNIKNPKAVKGRFYRCVRCPTAYHVGDFCIAAGSIHLAGSHIVCSDHFQPNRSLSCHSRLNITWCFSCSKGGTLLCCESCPAAFHAECVKVDKTPEEAWFCVDCAAGRKPLYGNIVWIKVGNYRWWPGEICHPRHVPLNIQEKAHQVGEFPVRFFGSHDYYWIHRGRVFLFQEGDKGSREGSSRGLFKIYMKGIKEATEAFKLWMAAKAKKVEQEQERNDKKPAPYKFIKSNVPIGNVQMHKAELSEIPRCECKPDQEDACNSDCLNRMMMYECHPSMCPAGEKCHNQRFQKRQYPECEPFKSETRGWGLRCLEDIKKGQFVHEYVGDLIDEEECKRRIEQAHEDNITNFYMLTMDKNRIIDAGPKGNFSRFMNHSCCPNLETQKWTVNGDIRVGLFALSDIPKGSEMTFNYNLECLGNEKKACACGAENCSGFLGVRPKTAAAAANEKKDPKKKRRKKKLDKRREHEDDCFRCGEGGELVMCDKGNCPKVYHLQCLKLTKPPSGKWLCPWHHCDDCGKLATVKCSECPNSYCAAHTHRNIFKVDDTHVCCDHTDLLEGISQSVGSCSSDGTNGIKSEIESGTSDNDAASTIEELADHEMEVDTDASASAAFTEVIGIIESKQNDLVSVGEAQKTVNGDIKAGIKQKSISAKVKDSSNRNSPVLPEKSAMMSGIEVKLEMPEASSSTFGELNFQADSGGVSLVNPSADNKGKPSQPPKPRKITEATACRTKARYKARLTSANNRNSKGRDSPVNKPVSNLQRYSSAGNPASVESDDTDSISDLIIDIP